MTIRHFISSDDIDEATQNKLIARAIELKGAGRDHPRPLEGRSIGLIFEKPSTRTRVSFEAGIYELGGNPIPLRPDEIQLGRGETIEDTSRVLSRYVDAIVVRTFGQDRIESLAAAASIPVVNALSDLEHPCQALADVMTIAERFEDMNSVDFAYLGDGNNMANSLMLAGAKAGLRRVKVATPMGYAPDETITARAQEIGSATGTEVIVTTDPIEAAKGAHVLYTDVWASMGQEKESEARLEAMKGFELNAERLADADPKAIVMHCLPAHRGEEISAEVIDGPSSVVWDQAENRLHAQKALMEWLLG
jgi:ornithine carbamoyltransferase